MTPDGGSGAGAALGFRPDPAEFAALAKEHADRARVVRGRRRHAPARRLAANVVGEGAGFLLESVEGGERWGRYSFVGRRPLATLLARGRHVEASGRLGRGAARRRHPRRCRIVGDPISKSPVLTGLPPLHGGLVGYLGYDVVREVERLPDPPVDDAGQPDAALVVIGQFCAFDHWRQRIVLIDNVVVPEAPDGVVDTEAVAVAYASACTRLRGAGRRLRRPRGPSRANWWPPRHPGSRRPRRGSRTMTSEEYQGCIGAAKEYITAGDIFQVVLSQRYDFTLDAEPLRRVPGAPPPQPEPVSLYFLRFPEVTVVAARRTEPMVRLLSRDGIVSSRPIAGSRPRGEKRAARPAARNPAGRVDLAGRSWRRAVALVDLARIDVERVVRFGIEKKWTS